MPLARSILRPGSAGGLLIALLLAPAVGMAQKKAEPRKAEARAKR